MKKIVLGDEKVSIAAFKSNTDFAVIAFVEPEEGADNMRIPFEEHDVSIHFKTKQAMNAFITHLIEIKKYMGLEGCDSATSEQ